MCVFTAFGIYYAFDSPYITINKGDFVHWSWTTPDFVNDVVHAIIEVDSPSSTTPKAGGFSSGTPTKNGELLWFGLYQTANLDQSELKAFADGKLTLSITIKFRLFQTERVCRFSAFSPFPTFSTLSLTEISSSVTFDMSSINAFNLDRYKTLSFGKELNLSQMTNFRVLQSERLYRRQFQIW